MHLSRQKHLQLLKVGYFFVVGILLTSLLAKIGFATTMRKLTINDLIHGAHKIVIGTCTAITSQWNEDHSYIFSHVTIQVSESLKGQPPPKIVLTQSGGVVGDKAMHVVGGATFRQGEEVLLFLREMSVRETKEGPKKIITRVFGMSQGKFTIVTDMATGRKITERDLSGIGFIGPKGEESESRKVYLEDFVAEIKENLRGN